VPTIEHIGTFRRSQSGIDEGCPNNPGRLLGGGEATIDGQDLPGDERRGRAAEEEGRTDHILGLGDAPERNPRQDVLAGHRVGSRRAPISPRTTAGATPLTMMRGAVERGRLSHGASLAELQQDERVRAYLGRLAVPATA
jgi:hypothetical protein